MDSNNQLEISEHVKFRGQITCTTASRNASCSDQNSQALFTPGMNMHPGGGLGCTLPHHICNMNTNASWTTTKDQLIGCVIIPARKYFIIARLFGNCTEHKALCCLTNGLSQFYNSRTKGAAFHSFIRHFTHFSFIYKFHKHIR